MELVSFGALKTFIDSSVIGETIVEVILSFNTFIGDDCGVEVVVVGAKYTNLVFHLGVYLTIGNYR